MAETVSLFGVPVSLVNHSTALEEVTALLVRKHPLWIVTPNPEHIIEAQRNRAFLKALQQADIALPDGIGLVWALNKKLQAEKDRHCVERVAGSDFMLALARYAAEQRWTVGLIGGEGGVAARAAQKLGDVCQGLKVVVLPYRKVDLNKKDTEVVQKITDLEIDVLFVAFGAPKQELWISNHINDLKNLKIAMGVGGAFDFLAGKLKRAPDWIQNLGFEWLYRLFQEPWRWKRQLRLIQFVQLVLREK